MPKFVLLTVPLTIVVLAILILAFQLNRQLYDQQQVIVNRLAHAAVRHAGQLQREHLRLTAIIEATTDAVDEEAFQLQWNLVESRIHVLKNTLDSVLPSTKMQELYDDYVNRWSALQPAMKGWSTDPQNAVLKSEITTTMAGIELNINLLAADLQLLFEDRMQNWAEKSLFLNRLLTIGSFSFVVIILLMSYVVYLFLHNQALNEEILRTSEQRLHVILDTIPDAVYRVSNTGLYTDYKPAANQTHRFSGETFYRKHLSDVLPSEIATLVQEGIQSVLASQHQLLLEYPLSDAMTNRVRHYEARLLPSGNAEVQIIVRDISDVKQQEEAALQAQKLESLGVLAGGIAHDFNNLLTGMLGQASLAATKLSRGLPALDHIQKVVLSTERAADLTRQLFAYTGKGKFQIIALDLNQLIRDTTALMGTVLPSHAKLVMALQDELPFVRVDRGQIQQVAMNLFINAIEALPTGEGTITITTGTQSINGAERTSQSAGSAQATSNNDLAAGLYAVLQVADSGIGMDQATLSRIFDPFFSTKPKGHGLGLAATMGIIRTHQAHCKFRANPVAVPPLLCCCPPILRNKARRRRNWHCSAPVIPQRTTDCILIIDDEAPVLEVVTDILAGEGFQVTTATNGHEGIELFRLNHQTIDLILLDMKMPGIDGIETYQQLLQNSGGS